MKYQKYISINNRHSEITAILAIGIFNIMPQNVLTKCLTIHSIMFTLYLKFIFLHHNQQEDNSKGILCTV